MSIQADFTQLDRNTIVMNEQILTDDFNQFLKIVHNKSPRHWTIIIQTPGGDVYSTIAIMNMILEMKVEGHTFTTISYGRAMSAGTYIWLMGDTRILYSGTSLLWHDLMGQALARSHQYGIPIPPAALDIMRICDKRLHDICKHQLKGIMTADEVDELLRGKAFRFMSAETAYKMGMVTTLLGKYIPHRRDGLR
jgi:ATP-dependent protease ClpP protease subunit